VVQLVMSFRYISIGAFIAVSLAFAVGKSVKICRWSSVQKMAKILWILIYFPL